MHSRSLESRITAAAETALAVNKYVRPIDVLVGIGWLDLGAEKQWRQGRIDFLEQKVQANLKKLSEAMELLRCWAGAKGLIATETKYVAQMGDRRTLRFSISGNPSMELAYRTHWISPELSEKKRARLAEKTSRPPELLVVRPLKPDWKCHRCGRTGAMLMMETAGPACLRCVGLDDLEFLSAGDALLTRRVKSRSTRRAVVVRFSRSRKRYERQGLLVEPRALAEATEELAKEQRGSDLA